MNEASPTIHLVWIVRRGSGRAQVHPSPVHVRAGDTIRIKNWTREDTTVGPIAPLYPAGAKVGFHVRTATVTIPAGGSADLPVDPGDGFFEYDVTFGSSSHYAEGNSKPGVIVDG